jgi:ABC-type transport system involved in multi-copper enzyme maturation permease subunit
MILDCIRAELLKLRRRPATWVLAGVYVIAVLVFNYLFLYLLIRSGQMEQAGGAVDADQVLLDLLPTGLTSAVVSSAASFGASVALILGALAVGSEYGWGTVKTVAVQRPGRGAIAVGRLASVAVVALGYALVAAVTAIVASFAIGALESADLAPPPAVELIASVGSAWLLLTVWATLGMALATLFRGTGLAIGLGLVWALVVESLAASFPLPGRAGDLVGRVLLGANGNALAGAFGDVSAFGVPEPLNTPQQALLALGLYLLLFTALVVVPFLRREIR